MGRLPLPLLSVEATFVFSKHRRLFAVAATACVLLVAALVAWMVVRHTDCTNPTRHVGIPATELRVPETDEERLARARMILNGYFSLREMDSWRVADGKLYDGDRQIGTVDLGGQGASVCDLPRHR